MESCRKIYAAISLITISFFVAPSSFGQLQFIENKGQWDKAVEFKSDFKTGSFYLQHKGFTVLLHSEKDLELLSQKLHGNDDGNKNILIKARVAAPPPLPASKAVTVHSHAYKVNFLGASSNVQPIADKAISSYNNYFIGNDKSKWQSGCKIYQGITYKNMYPNIDVRYYTDQGTLKYDLIVHPGGNINAIALQYEGVNSLQVQNKELIIGTSVGEVKELYPYTYQVMNKGRQTLDCKYVVKNNIVTFKVKDYSPNATIIIDPQLIFCSFAGSTSDNWGYTATPGPDGSFFAGGISFGDGYPTSPGAFDQTWNNGAQEDNTGPYDIAIIKLSADGSQRLYATYLGGSGNEQPHSMICDAQGNLTVAGRSSSVDYPKFNPASEAGGGYDIVVTKFNATGTNLIGSVKIGGSADDGVNIKSKYSQVTSTQADGAFDTRRNYGDDARSEVILDANNNILLASCTQSSNFPTTVGVFQNGFGGGGSEIKQDGVIMKFTPNLGSIIFSTFFGGSGNDACFVLSINPLTGNVFVAGATTSKDLPGNTTGALLPSYQGGVTDGFITQIKPDGSSIIKTTYIGTTGNDLVYGIQFDKFGFPYIMGTTTGDWKAKNAAFKNAGGKQFIAKLQPDLSAYVYSTMFGTGDGSPNISPIAFLVDRCQNVYVSGWGGTFNVAKGYPSAGTTGLPVVNAIKSTTDGNDFYFFVLEKDATSQLFGSFFGQNGGFNDHVDGGTSRFDANGIIYQSICANCNNGQLGGFFPTTPGVWAATNRSIGCSNAALKIEMNFAGVGASVKATVNGVVDTVGCVPLTIRFTDTLAKGKRYIWDFGDATPRVTTLAPNNSTDHIYTNVGVYKLMLVSIDSSTCNITDTAYVTVKVGNNIVVPNFIPQKQQPCTNLTFNFINTTTAARPAYTNQTFTWDFGDGSPRQKEGFYTVSHQYASEGRYKITLLVDDSTFCNSPDSISQEIRLAINVIAKIETPAKVCVNIPVAFVNNSAAGTDFTWTFGDGSPATNDVSPVHTYTQPGSYVVKLVAKDTSTCNKIDSTSATVQVLSIPVADFTFSPLEPEENKPAFFTSISSGATMLKWDFSDGEFSSLPNPTHQFNATGTFNVCLIATNDAGCSDTICYPVKAKIKPLLDVPNAFTPGRFGINGIIKVTGFGIGKMDWKIYNRWGQVVFASTSRFSGWDGTFKGALQPIDVYTYTLDVQFTDGKKVRKTGDITLLR